MICPLCATFNDPALNASGRTPPQDWLPLICVGCHTILTTDHRWPGGLRTPDDDDWAAWHHDPHLARFLTAFQTLKEDPDA